MQLIKKGFNFKILAKRTMDSLNEQSLQDFRSSFVSLKDKNEDLSYIHYIRATYDEKNAQEKKDIRKAWEKDFVDSRTQPTEAISTTANEFEMDLPSVPPALNKKDSPSLLIDNFVEEESYDVLYMPSFYSAQEVQRLGIPDRLPKPPSLIPLVAEVRAFNDR